MPRPHQDGSRQQVLDVILVAVRKAAREAAPISLADQTEQLLRSFPDCGMSRQQIRDFIATHAVATGAPILLD